MTLSDERVDELLGELLVPLTQDNSHSAIYHYVGGAIRVAVREALQAERLAEVEARGAHLAEHHPDGERAELSDEWICGMLVSHGYHPGISIVAAVRDIISGSRSAEAPSSGKWNDVVKALSELHEVYFLEGITSDADMLDALENLMDVYVAWLD